MGATTNCFLYRISYSVCVSPSSTRWISCRTSTAASTMIANLSTTHLVLKYGGEKNIILGLYWLLRGETRKQEPCEVFNGIHIKVRSPSVTNSWQIFSTISHSQGNRVLNLLFLRWHLCCAVVVWNVECFSNLFHKSNAFYLCLISHMHTREANCLFYKNSFTMQDVGGLCTKLS